MRCPLRQRVRVDDTRTVVCAEIGGAELLDGAAVVVDAKHCYSLKHCCLTAKSRVRGALHEGWKEWAAGMNGGMKREEKERGGNE